MPKRLRDELGLAAGQELEVAVRDGRLEIEAPPTPMRLERVDGRPVAATERQMPVLTAEQVRETLQGVRR